MSRRFAGPAVITGAGQGIGRAFALALGTEGVAVVIADLNVARAENAAIFSTLATRPFTEIPFEEWSNVLAVNVTGAFLCARALLPGMVAARGGKVVNISSTTVLLGRPNYLHCVTSKAA